MRRWLAAMVAVMTAAAVSPVSAEQAPGRTSLSQISGRVLVNGRPYAGGPLNQGDVITAIGNGAAMLSFPDGCQIGVSAGAPITVGASSPCSVGTNNPINNPYVAVGVVAGVGAVAGIVVVTQHKSVSP